MTSAKFIALSVFALAGTVILLALGGWQLQRMQWKEALLAQLQEREAAEPVALPVAAEMFTRSTGDVRFLKVTAQGRYRHDAEMHLYGIWSKQPGWRIVTPLESGDLVVLVIRGFVPEAHKARESRRDGLPDGDIDILGKLRFGEVQGTFLPDNAVASNQWYWRDLSAMQEAAGVGGAARFAPFFIELQTPDHSGEWPRLAPVSAAQLHNRHFSYALTWFGLAGTLLVVYGFVFLARRKA